VDYTVDGYFSSKENYQEGITAPFVDRPATLSQCELEQLHTDCVDRINMYRTGALKFADGTTDSRVAAGLSVLKESTSTNQCSSHQALGDLVASRPLGYTCEMAHHTAHSCAGMSGQNSCCFSLKGTTYSGVKEALFKCLQKMWDEGITPGQKGHWETMRASGHTHASCGFAWHEDGNLAMNQDFFMSETKQPCSCEGKQPGESDGCGGNCARCSEPVEVPCRDTRADCEDAAKWNWCREDFPSILSGCPLTCGTCPVIEPTCPEGGGSPATPDDGDCADDPDYVGPLGSLAGVGDTCAHWQAWVSRGEARCADFKDQGLLDSCPKACGVCGASPPTPVPTAAPTASCADSPDYVGKWNDDTCAHWQVWVSRGQARCADFQDQDLLDSCPKACGLCG
jgi:hypothetical protein